MTTLARAFAVLDVFERGPAVIAADDVCAKLGYSRPTGYRYIGELVEAGFLTRVGGGSYALGPRIIELDYNLRVKDPVLAAARPVMHQVVDATGGECTLSSMYGDRIVTTHHERGPEHLVLGHDRGKPMPLVRGAMSRCLLAFQAVSRQKRLFERCSSEIAEQPWGGEWVSFRGMLNGVRKSGHAVSLNELGGGRAAVAAPIFHREGGILAAIAVVLSLPRYRLVDEKQLIELVTSAARRIEYAMRLPAIDRPDAEAGRGLAGDPRRDIKGDKRWPGQKGKVAAGE